MPGSRWINLLIQQDCRLEICTEKKTILSVDDILALIGDRCDGVIGQLTENWGETLFSALSRAGGKAFSNMVVGYNVDVEAANKYGVAVGNTSCLSKPPMKESTKPVDRVLHSDIRAVERAEFDHQILRESAPIRDDPSKRDRMQEGWKERLQKMAEEEEIKRLRKELVPKAQPMPYFDRPFIPRRSTKDPTIPREPKFHIPRHKKINCCMFWNDLFIHNNNEWGMQQ